VLESRTGIQGDFEIGTTQTGNINVTFSKPEYQSKTIAIRFESGIPISQNIALLPIDSTDNTTSLKSLHLLSNFEASPNPFREELTINFNLDNSINEALFILTDIMGRVIKKVELEKTKGKLSISNEIFH